MGPEDIAEGALLLAHSHRLRPGRQLFLLTSGLIQPNERSSEILSLWLGPEEEETVVQRLGLYLSFFSIVWPSIKRKRINWAINRKD